ncbi:hypothetical protein CH272_28235 [Rhodococcus sp. 05-340-1]|nr:hypothetical protein CH254_14880 [Rhodococcus sp. 06-412-2C]OZC96477.1 hypothetical protein CH279_15045 [Rhodococcus sp. 06-412-2B]OZD65271.1 hypothetical protein CH271_19670 [Rhodococcus sp. 05-340-2]OZD69305.1 hypothetical protein CH272_28235 [Rhodococcus sp. 05-340-1]
MNIMTERTDHQALSEWAENEMTLPTHSTTALRGADAAAAGRALLERAGGGRPPLDPNAQPGEESPRRQVRLPKPLSDSVDAIAERQGRRPADVMREAIAAYAASHSSPA